VFRASKGKSKWNSKFQHRKNWQMEGTAVASGQQMVQTTEVRRWMWQLQERRGLALLI